MDRHTLSVSLILRVSYVGTNESFIEGAFSFSKRHLGYVETMVKYWMLECCSNTNKASQVFTNLWTLLATILSIF